MVTIPMIEAHLVTGLCFDGVFMSEWGSHSHGAIDGSGTGLDAYDFNGNKNVTSINTSVNDPLYITSVNNNNANADWGVQTVGFSLLVIPESGPVEIGDISIQVGSGGEIVLSWEGDATHDVLTNNNLLFPSGWGVADSGAASPVTNAATSDPQLFYKLSE